MYDTNKDTKSFTKLGKMTIKMTVFDSIAKSCIQNPTKSLLTFFATKPHHKCSTCSKKAPVACKEKRNKLSYMILHNFI